MQLLELLHLPLLPMRGLVSDASTLRARHLFARAALTTSIDVPALRHAVEVERLTNFQCVIRFAPTNLTAVKRAIKVNQIHRFSTLQDCELDAILRNYRDVTTNMDVGRSMLHGHLRAVLPLHRVSKQRVCRSLTRVNPFRRYRRAAVTGRGPYLTRGPGGRYCLDGNEKLQFVKIYISGGCDAYSRFIPYYDVSGNKRPETVLFAHCAGLATACNGRIFDALRCDAGTENVLVRRLYRFYGRQVSVGKSLYNIRVETLWRQVNQCTLLMKKELTSLRRSGELVVEYPEHLFSVHQV